MPHPAFKPTLPLIILAVLACFTRPVLADSEQTVRRTTGPGQQVEVQWHYHVDSRCYPLPGPEITITRPPKHGQVTTRQETRRVDTRPAVGESNCTGREVTSTVVYYKPNMGYVGSDQFEYDRKLSTDLRHVTTRIRINPS